MYFHRTLELHNKIIYQVHSNTTYYQPLYSRQNVIIRKNHKCNMYLQAPSQLQSFQMHEAP